MQCDRLSLTCQRLQENLSHWMNKRDSILTVGCYLICQCCVTSCHKIYDMQLWQLMLISVFAVYLSVCHHSWQLFLLTKTLHFHHDGRKLKDAKLLLDWCNLTIKHLQPASSGRIKEQKHTSNQKETILYNYYVWLPWQLVNKISNHTAW